MKRFLVIAISCLFLFACGQAARQSGFYEHDTMYRDWSHLWFSWFGYRDVSPKEAEKSQEESWWGIPEGSQQKEIQAPRAEKQ